MVVVENDVSLFEGLMDFIPDFADEVNIHSLWQIQWDYLAQILQGMDDIEKQEFCVGLLKSIRSKWLDGYCYWGYYSLCLVYLGDE